MSGRELSAEEAAGMTREQALRAMATMEGVSPHDKRMAEIMLEGPAITSADQAVLQTRWRMLPMVGAVHLALAHLGQQLADEHESGMADLHALSGGLA